MSHSLESLIRLPMSTADGHDGGGLVDRTHITRVFGDTVTELLIHRDGEKEGFIRAMQSEFLAPVPGGDYIEARAKLFPVEKAARKLKCGAHKIIEAEDSAAKLLAQPVLIVAGTGVAAVALEKQRPSAR